jgi:hypothetical protein
MDAQTTPRDGNCYAFLGEVSQGIVMTVAFPNNAFLMIMNVRAKTSDYAATHLEEIGNKGFSPILGINPESAIMNSWQIMYLPSKYVALFLNAAGYTLRQAWESLYLALVMNNDLVMCAP